MEGLQYRDKNLAGLWWIIGPPMRSFRCGNNCYCQKLSLWSHMNDCWSLASDLSHQSKLIHLNSLIVDERGSSKSKSFVNLKVDSFLLGFVVLIWVWFNIRYILLYYFRVHSFYVEFVVLIWGFWCYFIVKIIYTYWLCYDLLCFHICNEFM